MLIPDTHIIKIRFKIYNNTLPNKWIELKKMCENGDNKKIIFELLSYCKLDSVKNLPYLNRCEGGIVEIIIL